MLDAKEDYLFMMDFQEIWDPMLRLREANIIDWRCYDDGNHTLRLEEDGITDWRY